jgi:hypothetical protein
VPDLSVLWIVLLLFAPFAILSRLVPRRVSARRDGARRPRGQAGEVRR